MTLYGLKTARGIGMKISRILGTFVWSIEHVLYGPRFLKELGTVWYKFWVRTPIDHNNSLCIFCKKENMKEELKKN